VVRGHQGVWQLWCGYRIWEVDRQGWCLVRLGGVVYGLG
jgi:hypothetical protein